MHTLLAHLASSRTALLAEVDGLQGAQWVARPSDGSWSMLEVIEHLATVEIGVHDLLSTKLFLRPCAPEHKAQTIGKDQIIVDAMRDRMTRRMAPDIVKPASRWPSAETALAAFGEARGAIVELLSKETRNLRDYCAPHPSLRALDGYQWILFLVTHTDRHREQIRDIRNHIGIPRRM